MVIPLDDSTEYVWFLTEDEVKFADKIEDFEKEEHYAYSIYRQRFLPKWIYEGEEYTMVCVDTHVDGNKFLQVFSNNKKIEAIDGII